MYLKHLYFGDGKGKTTAALGLAVRAAGRKMKVSVIQFLKGGDTGELYSLEQLENITIKRCDRNYGFSFRMSEDDKREITKCHNDLFDYGERLIREGGAQMVIFDELTDAYNLNLIDRQKVLNFLSEKPLAEIIITGHNPDKAFIEACDYVSQIKALKHPFADGIGGRMGIEY